MTVHVVAGFEVSTEAPLETPIKTLDLPVAGRGYSVDTVRLLFDFVNLANDMLRRAPKKKAKDGPAEQIADDSDGTQTVRFLKNIRRIASRISGNSPASLGLHPAVYFYGATGRYQPTAFLATASLIKELERENGFIGFTAARARFEDFLLRHRYFTNQIVTGFGSGIRGQGWLLRLYRVILARIGEGRSDEEILADLLADQEFRVLKAVSLDVKTARAAFSTETKSAAYLREAIDTAVRCAICHARIHSKGISIDHAMRVADGGAGAVENAQVTHPFCNTGYKEHLTARQRG